jgi:hypothetical protein
LYSGGELPVVIETQAKFKVERGPTADAPSSPPKLARDNPLSSMKVAPHPSVSLKSKILVMGMRATFITTALENGAQLEDVQKAAGHRDPSTTKLYDRRGYNPEEAASFFATY